MPVKEKKKSPEFLEIQWKQWQESNPKKAWKHVTTEQLKSSLLKDLQFVSAMDVKEYTLYQKWCEIHEKYETEETSTLSMFFGGDSATEPTLIIPERGHLIDAVKRNFWYPETPESYEQLQPIMVLSDKDDVEVWNVIRTFSSTMKNNSNIGRNLFYTIIDKVSGKYLGVICISSDFLDLTPRDQFIGWSRDIKTKQNMINHTAIGSTIVPLQPLGFNYAGGKLLALLCLSDVVQKDWRNRYGEVLVGVTTTSLYGKTKVGGMSQYDGLEHWNKMGFSSGSVAYEPSRETKKLAWDWLKENHTREFFEWWAATKPNGLPYLRDHKNRSLHFIYRKLGIPKSMVRSEHQRGIYWSPLYNNTNEFLRKEIREKELVKSFDTSEKTLANIWKNKYAKGRMSQLKKRNQLMEGTLFYDDLIYLTWEETKLKYLTQVGR